MKKGFPVLRTERLLLRQFGMPDLENVFRGLSHPDIIKYYGISYSSLEETKAQMDFFARLEAEETGLWWAVCSPDNNIFYGGGGINDIKKEHKKGEIGFWLLSQYWGKGIMKEAMHVICKYAFEHMDLHRIEGIVETGNLNCKNAMKKSGFTHEGTMKECEIKNGAYIDLDIFAILNNRNVKTFG